MEYDFKQDMQCFMETDPDGMIKEHQETPERLREMAVELFGESSMPYVYDMDGIHVVELVNRDGEYEKMMGVQLQMFYQESIIQLKKNLENTKKILTPAKKILLGGYKPL